MYVILTEKCLQCGICTDSCPIVAIRLSGSEYFIDSRQCTGCRICVDSCPLELFRPRLIKPPENRGFLASLKELEVRLPKLEPVWR